MKLRSSLVQGVFRPSGWAGRVVLAQSGFFRALGGLVGAFWYAGSFRPSGETVGKSCPAGGIQGSKTVWALWWILLLISLRHHSLPWEGGGGGLRYCVGCFKGEFSRSCTLILMGLESYRFLWQQKDATSKLQNTLGCTWKTECFCSR